MGKAKKAAVPSPSNNSPLPLSSLLFRLLPTVVFFGGSAVVMTTIYNKYGMKIFLSQSAKQLSLTPDDWSEILPSKTLLMIGGPHRGGTTVVWNEIRMHPGIANFGSTFESGVDYSEGVFLQDVYPRFGVGEEYQYLSSIESKASRVRENGLGRYALGPEEAVHWTESNAAVTAENQVNVLNSWGYHWDNMSKPVWIEKSPPNLHMSRFFNALFNLKLGNTFDLRRDSTIKTHDPPLPLRDDGIVRFVFISRHPIANALAHRSLEECKHMSVPSLVDHWLAAHEYAHVDRLHLAHAVENAGLRNREVTLVKQLTLEGFAAEPARHLQDIWKWLGLPVEGDEPAAASAREFLAGAPERVRKDPNAKYRGQYCRAALSSPKAAATHRDLVASSEARVEALGLGYSLDEWPCLVATIKLAQKHHGGSAAVPSGDEPATEL